MACDELRAVAAELALGTLEGRERGEALTHLAECPVCRAHLESLSETADHLVALAPPAEPPAGFESGVVARIRVEGGDGATARRRGRLRAVAAALLLVLGGVGLGLLAAGADDTDDDETDNLASAPMEAPDGDAVGEVWRFGDEDAVVFVSVPAWADLDPTGSTAYSFRIEAPDGTATEVGSFTLGDGRSAWASTTDLDGDEIAAVSVVDDAGRVWCTGRFT
jgi:anti-sigma factor RsiW